MADLRKTLGADLLAATGRSGVRAAMAAFVFEAGFATVCVHRIARALYRGGFERTAKLLSRANAALGGCHLHLDARIGPGLKLPHPTGIVIGEGVVIGREAVVYQNTTIGRARRSGAYPRLGDGVTVYPSAVVVGGIAVGDGAVIGAGSVVRADVPARAVVAGNPARMLSVVPSAAAEDEAAVATVATVPSSGERATLSQA